MPRSSAICSGVLWLFNASKVALATLTWVFAPRDLATISLIPASSNTARAAPPAMIPRPSLAGFTKTTALPTLASASWGIVLPWLSATLHTFLLAACKAFLIASGTSLAFPLPIPTKPLRLPTATVAQKRKCLPPEVTFVTLVIE